MKALGRITECLAFSVCLAAAGCGWAAYLLGACPVIGARKGWDYAGGLVRRAMDRR